MFKLIVQKETREETVGIFPSLGAVTFHLRDMIQTGAWDKSWTAHVSRGRERWQFFEHPERPLSEEAQ